MFIFISNSFFLVILITSGGITERCVGQRWLSATFLISIILSSCHESGLCYGGENPAEQVPPLAAPHWGHVPRCKVQHDEGQVPRDLALPATRLHLDSLPTGPTMPLGCPTTQTRSQVCASALGVSKVLKRASEGGTAACPLPVGDQGKEPSTAPSSRWLR